MGQLPGELHRASLLHIQRLMKCMGILPYSQSLSAKVFSSVILLIAIAICTYQRLNFDYDLGYDFQNDHFSVTIDLTNFAALIASHVIIVLELVWGHGSKDVERKLQAIHIQINMYLGVPINTNRVRRYCNGIYASLVIRWIIFFLVTIYNNRALTFYAMYSEFILLARFSEFSLYCVVVLFLYQELIVGASKVLEELQRTRFELFSIRRLSLEKLVKLQRIHGSLWQSIRCLERYFQLSLITMLMKLFLDTSALPYWLYLNIIQSPELPVKCYVATDECIKILEIIVPCYICTRCDALQRKFRSMFYTITTDRRSSQLNTALRRLNLQLSQERCQFSAGGLVSINTEMLGKFIFGVFSYIIICIQFSINLRSSSFNKLVESSTPSAPI
ncbi:putative gustatory receptor 98a [Drosophila eugracilis]|uniref:putative gustatory receptor 98a n=1 Tax=Drosophila eugracilis TaxID=29029 RepID=UPI001BD990C4|nr:putative gustatory receptor 98a [Drosophila eugracilis]